ncbi:DUF2510 domain-containing protein [Kitasatospora sp. NPDC050543]|uniref:DUF2510 domain-containing protein n=1 Tax=Kitasatospora sp. NPDC050543 TaxID=3364054 RepID=UPI0037B55DBF
MSEQIPAGWYPDPQDTTTTPRPQRWWDGKGWTGSTRPAPLDAPPPQLPGAPAAETPAAEASTTETPSAAAPEGEETRVLEGQVLQDGPTVRFPQPPPLIGAAPAKKRRTLRRPSRPVLVTAAVAALLGLAVGSGVTYLAMGDHAQKRAGHRSGAFQFPGGKGLWGGPDAPGDGQGGKGDDGSGGGPGNGPGNGPGGKGNGRGNGNGGSNDGRSSSTTAADLVNRITLPIPAGWEGGTTPGGFAALTIGSYSCPGSGGGECSLGGATTSRITGPDVEAAAKADIAKAAKESYGEVASHEELKSEAVKVDGRDGYLVRWKVDAPQGNDGYVETVVFPAGQKDSKALVAVHLGFDVDPKAPDISVMDTIVKGIGAYSGKGLPGGADGGTTT